MPRPGRSNCKAMSTPCLSGTRKKNRNEQAGHDLRLRSPIPQQRPSHRPASRRDHGGRAPSCRFTPIMASPTVSRGGSMFMVLLALGGDTPPAGVRAAGPRPRAGSDGWPVPPLRLFALCRRNGRRRDLRRRQAHQGSGRSLSRPRPGPTARRSPRRAMPRSWRRSPAMSSACRRPPRRRRRRGWRATCARSRPCSRQFRSHISNTGSLVFPAAAGHSIEGTAP